MPLGVSSSTLKETEALLADTLRLDNGPLNFVLGVAFDNDADALPDNTTSAKY